MYLMAHQDTIVADGRQRLRNTERCRLKERGLQEAVARKYEPELATAGSVKHLIIQVKMWRDLRREIDTLASERSLYLNPPR